MGNTVVTEFVSELGFVSWTLAKKRSAGGRFVMGGYVKLLFRTAAEDSAPIPAVDPRALRRL